MIVVLWHEHRNLGRCVMPSTMLILDILERLVTTWYHFLFGTPL